MENASRYARYIASGQQRMRMKDRPVSYRTKQTPSQDLVYGHGGNWVRASRVSRFVWRESRVFLPPPHAAAAAFAPTARRARGLHT